VTKETTTMDETKSETATPSALIDARIAELIDSKAGLAARALDGAAGPREDEDSVQMLTLMSVLQRALDS